MPRKTDPAKFQAEQFTPTKFDTAADKAWFANYFMRFVASDFSHSLFTKRFYNRIMHTFGHIAHYDRDGFYATFFTNTADKVDFLQQTLRYGCFGSPEYTYCDVERALATRLRADGTLARYEAQLEAETEAAELALLARLQSKYASKVAA